MSTKNYTTGTSVGTLVAGDDSRFSQLTTNTSAISTLQGAVTANTAGVGKLTLTPVTKTSAYLASAGDLVLCDASGAAFSVTLPPAPADGVSVAVKKIDSSTNGITVTAGGSDTFVAATTTALPAQGQAVTYRYQSSTAKWVSLSSDLPLTLTDARYSTPGAVTSAIASQAAADASTYVQQFKANTAYSIGQTIVAPDGSVVSATASFTSAASYSASNWTLLTPTTPQIASQLFGSRRIGFAGDSITVGSGASSAGNRYSTQVSKIAGSARAAEVLNGGVAGDTSAQLLARMPAILANSLDHIHIQIGTNDSGVSVPLATYQANIISIVKLIRAAGMTASIGTIIPRTSTSGSAATIDPFIKTYNLWLNFWAPRNGVLLADTHAVIADPTSGYASSALMGGDGVHPNDAGHLAMAKVIASVIPARHDAPPWPVSGVSSIGLIANPLMNGTAGWSDQGGTATNPVFGTTASTGYDELPYGNWLTTQIDNSGGSGGVYRQIAATLNSSLYSANDQILLCGWMNHSDTTNATSWKLQVTNNFTAFTVPLDTGGSVYNPGPFMFNFAIPASPNGVRVGFVLYVPPGLNVTGYCGAVQAYNMTTGGLLGLT